MSTPTTMKVRCPCGAHYRVQAQHAGRRARCRRCQRVLRVPQPPQPPARQGLIEPPPEEEVQLLLVTAGNGPEPEPEDLLQSTAYGSESVAGPGVVDGGYGPGGALAVDDADAQDDPLRELAAQAAAAAPPLAEDGEPDGAESDLEPARAAARADETTGYELADDVPAGRASRAATASPSAAPRANGQPAAYPAPARFQSRRGLFSHLITWLGALALVGAGTWALSHHLGFDLSPTVPRGQIRAVEQWVFTALNEALDEHRAGSEAFSVQNLEWRGSGIGGGDSATFSGTVRAPWGEVGTVRGRYDFTDGRLSATFTIEDRREQLQRTAPPDVIEAARATAQED